MKGSKEAAAFMTKRALIDKANTTTLVAAGVAAFLVVFSLVSAKALVSQLTYQQHIISAKKATRDQIATDLKAKDKLAAAYKIFTDTPTNIIGGDSQGTGDKDGDNAKIILDALPSKYDFPALTASLEKLADAQGLKITGITGDDDEVAQASQQVSATPKPIPLTFELTVEGAYSQMQGLITSFEKSIRPIQPQTISIESSDKGIKTTIDGQTFYQPEKKLELQEKVMGANGKIVTPATPAATATTTTTSKAAK